jgi:hypothetical protein
VINHFYLLPRDRGRAFICSPLTMTWKYFFTALCKEVVVSKNMSFSIHVQVRHQPPKLPLGGLRPPLRFMRGRRASPQTPPLNDSPTPTPSQPHANPKLCFFCIFFENKKDARRPYDHFPLSFAPRSLLCVRKRRFPFLKKDLILSVIWSVICPRNLPRNLLSEFASKKWSRKCPSNPTSTCAGGQDDVSSQVSSLKRHGCTCAVYNRLAVILVRTRFLSS